MYDSYSYPRRPPQLHRLHRPPSPKGSVQKVARSMRSRAVGREIIGRYFLLFPLETTESLTPNMESPCKCEKLLQPVNIMLM
jgi:hypothetical protein